MIRSPRRLAALTVAVLALSACASRVDSADAPAAAPIAATTPSPVGPVAEDPRAPLAADSVVPDVEVVDVASGLPVSLTRSVASDKPVLLWAWAPHCPSCRAEAAGLEQFAAANTDRLTVVGLGTQDDLEYAREFVADTGVRTPQMLWDASFESWQQLGITAQPTWILVRGDGTFLGGWVGGLPEQQILDLV
ncbi:MAG: TlpA family protein disulfide reductase [Actinomycetota bacterium]|nr:TlpA family protein disulfide reductase [Actinomycetota bacterium]